MSVKSSAINKVESVNVNIPPSRDNLGKMIGVGIGLALMLSGVLMILSIVLIIPGFFLILIGLVVLASSAPKTTVDCPSCDAVNKVPLKSKQLKCAGCDSVTPLTWNK